MNEDLTPPSPALEAELLRALPPEHKAVLRRILIARDALVAERDLLRLAVECQEDRWRVFQSESCQLIALEGLRKKAQEVRRAWDAFPKIEWRTSEGVRAHGRLRAAIDALVPTVPAGVPSETRPRDECPNCFSAETGGRPNYDPADCIVCHGSGLAPPENEKEARS